MNKRTRSVSLIVTAIMLVSLLVAFPAFKTTAADTNYALKTAGASYTVATLATDGSEGAAAWYSNGTDSSYTALTDGTTNIGEVAGQYAGLVGTGKTHRFKFDLGASKTGLNKIVLQNMVNSANELYNGSAAGNRGYNLSGIKVQAGASTSAMSAVTASATEAANGDKYSYEVTITFSAVSARYVWIDVPAASNAYVLTVDEIQIWGSSSSTSPSQTQPSVTNPQPTENANYALATAGAKYTIASLTDGSEGDPAWLNANYTDSSYTFLNNGVTNMGEVANQSVGLMGTGKTHRFKFDLGGIKTNITKIVLQNMVNSVNEMYNGSPAGNRGYVLSSIKATAGATTSSMSNITVSASEKANGTAYSYEVTLQFAAVDARYVYIDITSAGYVLSIDEIQIWGGSSTPVVTDAKFDLVASAPENVQAGEQFDVTIEAKNIKATNGLVGVDFVLTFESSKVSAVYTTDDAMTANFFAKNPGSRWEDAGCYYNASSSLYNIRFADKDATTAYGIKADNTLVFKVAFKANANLAAGTTIKFVVKDVIGTDPGDASYNGFGDVDGQGSEANAVVAAPTTTVAPTTTTETPVTIVYGDVNGDGEANSIDATLVLRYDSGLANLSAEALIAGDVNGDGEVSSMDATYILRFDSGLISVFPAQN